jgi:hypothetical protein
LVQIIASVLASVRRESAHFVGTLGGKSATRARTRIAGSHS